MNALDVLCMQLTRDLFAIAKFLFSNNEDTNCCLQMRFLGSKYANDAFAAGALPQTPLR